MGAIRAWWQWIRRIPKTWTSQPNQVPALTKVASKELAAPDIPKTSRR
jgi:hypothetical protein